MKTINFFILLIGCVLIFMGILEMEFNRKRGCKKWNIELYQEIYMMKYLQQI